MVYFVLMPGSKQETASMVYFVLMPGSKQETCQYGVLCPEATLVVVLNRKQETLPAWRTLS